MPYSITTKDGITIQNIPDDVLPDSQSLKDRVASIRSQQGGAEPSMLSRVGSGIAEAFTGSARETADTQALPDIGGLPELSQLSLASAKTALGTIAANPQETAQIVQANFPGAQVRQDDKGNYIIRSSIDGQEYAIKPGFQISDIPKTIASMLAFTPAGRVSGVVRGAAAGAATQGAIEGTQAATGGGASAEDVGIAGLIGGAVPAIGGAIRTVRGAIQGNSQAPLVAAAEQAKIPLLTSDVAPPTTFAGRTGQAIGERVPVAGTGPVRAAQQDARAEAVRTLARDYGADVATNVDQKIVAELQRKRGDALTKYTALKKDAFSAIQGQKINTRNATAQIDTELASLRKLNDPSLNPVITQLENTRQSLQNQTIDEIETARKLLGDKITSPELASARSVTDKIPSRVYDALKTDIKDALAQSGDKKAVVKWQVANARLRELAGEADNVKLRTVLNDGMDSPETVEALLFSAKPSDVQRLYRNLTPNGRAAAQIAILQRAVAKSDGLERISPDKFKQQIGKLGSQVGIFFKPQEAQRITGLLKVLQATERAGVAAANPPTGAQLAIPVVSAALADVLGSGGAAITTGAAIGGMARVYESAAVRNLLTRIASAPQGSRAEQALIAQLRTAATAAQAGKSIQGESK